MTDSRSAIEGCREGAAANSGSAPLSTLAPRVLR